MTIDIAELRNRAEAAMPGKNWPTSHFFTQKSREDNEAFRAAAQPTTVLALLDRIEELEGALRPFAESEGIPESACTYCGDYSHDAHRCRAGGHNFEPTGDEVHSFNKAQIDAARKAFSGEKP